MGNKRVLMLASVASMIQQFNMPNIRLLQHMGYEVHVACNFNSGNTCTPEKVDELKFELGEISVHWYQIDFSRSIMSLGDNLRAYKQVKALLKTNKYAMLHCHSPIGGVVGRLSARKQDTKVIYTAHGFHFFKGAPLCNWLLYYPVEKFCSRFTDVLITINKEDYALAQKKMKAKRVVYIPGVGIDVAKFADTKIDRPAKRQELGIGSDDIMLLSVGELSKRKNHETVIRAVAALNNPRVHYFIAGTGNLQAYLKDMINEHHLGEKIHLLGYCADIPQLCKAADIFVFPSLQEGLPVALMEAMAAGLPCVASKIRGNIDLIEDDAGGYLCDPRDSTAFEEVIGKMLFTEKWLKHAEYNRKAIEAFDADNIICLVEELYNKLYEKGMDEKAVC